MKYLLKSINDFSDSEINQFFSNIKEPKHSILLKMNKKRFRQSVVGEILLYKLLKENNIDYDSINVQYNNNGKPYIENYQIYYNIGHDNDMVICAINSSLIGVDILKVKKIKLGIMNTFCTKDELNNITNLIELYKVFTMKEAYIKLLGMTISDIKNINYNQILLEEKYMCKSMIIDNYIISICYQK